MVWRQFQWRTALRTKWIWQWWECWGGRWDAQEGSWTNSKNQSKTFPKRSLEIRVYWLREYATIPQGGGATAPSPPLGEHLHALSNTREVRISSDRLGKVFFGFVWKSVQDQKSWFVFVFSTMIPIMKIQLPALLLSSYAAETMPIFQISKKTSK